MDTAASYRAETRAQFYCTLVLGSLLLHSQIFLEYSFYARHQGHRLESDHVPPGTYELQGAQSLKRQASKQLQYSVVRGVIEGHTGQ